MNSRIIVFSLILFIACATAPMTGKSDKEMKLDTISSVKKALVLIQTSVSCGTGTIIDPRGLVLTAYHIVEGHEKDTLNLETWNQGNYKAVYLLSLNLDCKKLVGFPFYTDIAILKIINLQKPLNYAAIETVDVKEGDNIDYFGYAFCGSELINRPSLRKGIVSKYLEWDIDKYKFHIFEIDNLSNPGNSGGPIFNINTGKVFGILTSTRNFYPNNKMNKKIVTTDNDTLRIGDFSPPSGITYGISINAIVETIKKIQNKY